MRKKRHNNRKKAWLRSWIALSAVLLGFATAHFQISTPNPVTGKREIVLINEQKEIEIGSIIYVQLQNESGGLYVENPEINAYVTRVGQKIAALSDRPDLPYQFVVINNDAPNAWAAPGGKIAINIGLLVLLDNEAELAAVLAHEIAHASARHTAQRMERDMLLNGIAYVDIAVNPLGMVNTTLDINSELKEFKYSRDAEREADEYGMEYLSRAGYDVKAATAVHKKLHVFFHQDEDSESLINTLYYSHPSDEERMSTSESRRQEYAEGGFTGEEEFNQVAGELKSNYVLPAWE